MISVIIPTLNEEISFPATLASLRASRSAHEVIVVDAGSSDRTVEIAQQTGARVQLSQRRQRAAQMNLGTRDARGEIFLFLHADTQLPPEALARVEEALKEPDRVGGAFARTFEGKSWFLAVTCRLAEIRSRRHGIFLGDQAIFIRREIFEEMGGFRELDLFEDLDLSCRMREIGKVVTLSPPVVSSLRHVKDLGPVRTTLRDLHLGIRFLQGEDPVRLTAVAKQWHSSSAGGQDLFIGLGDLLFAIRFLCRKSSAPPVSWVEAGTDRALKISVVIPTLNEEEHLPRLLRQILPGADEVWVADGGSSDATLKEARRFHVKILESPPGRGIQMNAAAKHATGDLIWFLHADSLVPPNWKGQMLSALADPDVRGGGFRVVIDSHGIRYRVLDFWGRIRPILQKSLYGDQGIFVRREVFNRIGGFPNRSVLEDVEFSSRLWSLGKVVLLRGPLRTSARRWEKEGYWRTVLNHLQIALSYPAESVAVVLMAKAPIPGRVKTRLVPPLTPEEAAALAERLLKETVGVVHQLKGIRAIVAVWPAEAMEHVRRILPHRVTMIPQPEGDLGERLDRLFSQVLGDRFRGAVALGTDHPNLPAPYLKEAVEFLRRGSDEVVLGPTEDGGYYLIGLNRLHPELFTGIPWSSSEVFRTTLEKARVLGLAVKQLPPWYDIDRPEDLARFKVK